MASGVWRQASANYRWQSVKTARRAKPVARMTFRTIIAWRRRAISSERRSSNFRSASSTAGGSAAGSDVCVEYHVAKTVPQREQAVVDGSSKWHIGQIV